MSNSLEVRKLPRYDVIDYKTQSNVIVYFQSINLEYEERRCPTWIFTLCNMDSDLQILNQKMRMVDPNDILDLRHPEANDSESTGCSVSENIKKGTKIYPVPLISKYQALCAMMPFLSLQSNPCFLKAAKDFVQRLALTSYLMRKKLPKQICLRCDGIHTPSRELSPERKDEWTLSFTDDVFSEPFISQITDDVTSNSVVISNDFVVKNSETARRRLFYNSDYGEECYADYKERRDAQESLIQQSIADQISDYVTFPTVTTKFENRIKLFYDCNMDFSSAKEDKFSKIKPKFIELNRKRRHQRSRRRDFEPEVEEPDVTIQETVDLFMNMSSPIKSEGFNASTDSYQE